MVRGLRGKEPYTPAAEAPAASAVYVSPTPNPDSLKFTVDRLLVEEGSATFAAPARPGDPALVRDLLGVEGVRSLFLMEAMCTVTREPGADWDAIRPALTGAIRDYFAGGGASLDPQAAAARPQGELEGRIRDLIDSTVRPAVQNDGGDIVFAGLDDGVVRLHMLGSCSGCPSSTATLKMGVENLLKETFPEVRSVEAIT